MHPIEIDDLQPAYLPACLPACTETGRQTNKAGGGPLGGRWLCGSLSRSAFCLRCLCGSERSSAFQRGAMLCLRGASASAQWSALLLLLRGWASEPAVCLRYASDGQPMDPHHNSRPFFFLSSFFFFPSSALSLLIPIAHRYCSHCTLPPCHRLVKDLWPIRKGRNASNTGLQKTQVNSSCRNTIQYKNLPWGRSVTKLVSPPYLYQGTALTGLLLGELRLQ